jgi:DNA-binding NarL/FixJ family response regulator
MTFNMPSSSISVLIVDDIPFTRTAIRKILDQNARIRIVGEAGDGEEALSMFRVLLPDVVIMNICMPKKDGIVVTRGMCQIDPAARIIILTVQNAPEYVAAAKKAGACDVMVKPPYAEDLIQSVLKHGSKEGGPK